MIEQIQEIIIDNINVMTKTISIRKTTIFIENGIVIARSEPWRKTFCPGEIEEVKKVTQWDELSSELIYLNSTWTKQVIDDYTKLQNKNNEEVI